MSSAAPAVVPVHSSVGLDPDEARRFGGLVRLFGAEGAARIRAAHVLVVGIGGVGSWAVEALARSGVGRLTLIDLDHISEGNINRQIHALESTLGQAKVLAMQARIAQIHPACRVLAVDEFVEPGNWPALFERAVESLGPVQVVIDACDDQAAKVALAAWARAAPQAQGPDAAPAFIASGAAGGKRLAHRVDIGDLASVTHDPLLAQVRQRLRKQHGAPREGRRMGVHCVFSTEPVAPPDPSCDIAGSGDGSLNCHGFGSVVSVTATFGQCAAGWALDQIARMPRL